MTKSRSNATAPAAKGELVVGTGTDASTTLAVASTAGWLLSVDSAETTGLKWAAPSAAGYVGVAAYRDNSNVTINDATATAIGFGSEEWDTDSFHDNSTNNSRITIPSGKDGKYEFIVTASFNSNVGSAIQLRLYKNGSLVTSVGQANGNFAYFVGAIDYVAGTTVTSAVAGDYFEIFILQYSSGNSKTLSHARCVVNYLGA